MPRFIGARCGVNSTWAPPDLLLDLGRVPVVEQAVGREVLVDACRTAPQCFRPRPAPDTPDAASTMMPVGSIAPGRDERRQRQRWPP